MIKFSNVTLQRGANVLIENLDLTLFSKHKYGLIGANGSGKSSLFLMLQNKLEASAGDMEFQNSLLIAHLAQETPSSPETALNYVIAGDRKYDELTRAILAAEIAEDMDALMKLHTKLADMDGYTVESRAAKILYGLGFDEDAQKVPVSEFSGGWRMRLNLARCLLCPGDLLLLDEPTNHLDIGAVVWLEKWIRLYPGAVVVISHDQDFLDNTVQAILNVENQTVRQYKGNYAQFVQTRALQIAEQNAKAEKQANKKAHMMKFVDRFGAKASKAKQAQARIKAIEKMDAISFYYESLPFKFSFPEPDRNPSPLVKLDKGALGYGDDPVLSKLNLRVEPGSRIGLIGNNGEGKTTLIKALAGKLQPQAGECLLHNYCKVGYFAQHQIDDLDGSLNSFEHLQELDSKLTGQQGRNFLGRYNFSGDKAFMPVKDFSGGEKARLAFALLVYQKPNLLLLDEPTNHLDMGMREALNLALQSFAGAIVLVSHDRHLIRATADELWVVANGTVVSFSGTLEEYQQQYAN